MNSGQQGTFFLRIFSWCGLIFFCKNGFKTANTTREGISHPRPPIFQMVLLWFYVVLRRNTSISLTLLSRSTFRLAWLKKGQVSELSIRFWSLPPIFFYFIFWFWLYLFLCHILSTIVFCESFFIVNFITFYVIGSSMVLILFWERFHIYNQ